jgi:hypothetical protein
MKIKDLIRKLESFSDQGLEVSIFDPKTSSTINIDLVPGYMLCDETDLGASNEVLFTIDSGTGFFIEKGWAERILPESQKSFLDLTSPTIYPCLQISPKGRIPFYVEKTKQ